MLTPTQEKREITDASVPMTKITGETCFYVLNVKEGSESWSVQKRYSQFEDFHGRLITTALAAQVPNGVELPGKRIKLFTSHEDANFIEERRCLLEAYLKRLVNVKTLAASDMLIEFLSEGKLEVVVEENKLAKSKGLPEDVEVTGISIPATRTMSDHVLYQIDVQQQPQAIHLQQMDGAEAIWTVLRHGLCLA